MGVRTPTRDVDRLCLFMESGHLAVPQIEIGMNGSALFFLWYISVMPYVRKCSVKAARHAGWPNSSPPTAPTYTKYSARRASTQPCCSAYPLPSAQTSSAYSPTTSTFLPADNPVANPATDSSRFRHITSHISHQPHCTFVQKYYTGTASHLWYLSV